MIIFGHFDFSLRNISSAAIIFSLALFSSCMKNNQEEIKKTDSLMTIIDSAETKFLSVDTLRIKNILDSTEYKEMLIKKYSPDSLDKETTILLADYLRILKAMENFSFEKKNIVMQIALSRKQIYDMKHDLWKNTMSKEDFGKYLQEERKAIEQLCSYLNTISYKTNLMVAQYDFLKWKVDSFISTLDTTHENESKNPNLNQEFIDKD